MPENNLPVHQGYDSGDNKSSNEKENELKPTMPPAQAAIFSLIAVFFLYQIGGSILALVIFGFDLGNADMNALRLLTAGGQILLILAPALIFTKLVYNDITQVLRIKIPKLREFAFFILGLIVLIPLLQSYLYIQNYFIYQLADASSIIQTIKNFLDTINELVEKTYGELLMANNFIEGLLIIAIVSIIPGICEETFFRGFVQKSFELKYKPLKAAIITSLFFGIYHFNPYGLVALIVLGIYLGFAAYTSNSIFIPMTLHFLNNFVAIMAYFIFGSEEFMESNVVSKEGISTHVITFVLLLIVFFMLIYFIKKYYTDYKLERNSYDLSKL